MKLAHCWFHHSVYAFSQFHGISVSPQFSGSGGVASLLSLLRSPHDAIRQTAVWTLSVCAQSAEVAQQACQSGYVQSNYRRAWLYMTLMYHIAGKFDEDFNLAVFFSKFNSRQFSPLHCSVEGCWFFIQTKTAIFATNYIYT